MARKRKDRRRKTSGTTDIVSMRMPRDLHERLKDRAMSERVTKSRKIVEVLEAGLAPVEAGSVFE